MGSSKPHAMNNEVKTSLLVRKRVAPFWEGFEFATNHYITKEPFYRNGEFILSEKKNF